MAKANKTSIRQKQMEHFQEILASTQKIMAAARLKDIISSLHAGMTQEEVDAVVARIDAQATKLSGWGVDPDDPLPVPA